MITKLIEMRFKTELTYAMKLQLEALMQGSRREQGCLQYDIYNHLSKANAIFFVEKWQSLEHLELHRIGPIVFQFKRELGDLIEDKIDMSVAGNG
ncbi:putative quinol monooxygenase [Reinekea sp.]|jgi:quinol monooxygenase YgiN|uniref:putative quinol monooxygenase n=1 Tax=Reinekea sp. TaxID=1970455 RepID=UPI0039893BCE